MVLPRVIHLQDPLDPLLLLPIPAKLPSDPSTQIPTLLSLLEPHLNPNLQNDTKIPPTVITAQMRAINRHSYMLLNAARADAARAREDLDKKDTKLRGVEYERNRIREEIAKCMEYTPAYTAANLSDETAFFANAGADVLGGLPPKEDEGYAYAVIIARLEQELKEMEKREADLAALTRDRDALIRAKKEIKHKFDSLETWLNDYARSTTVLASRLAEPTKVKLPELSSLSAPIVEVTTPPPPDAPQTETSEPSAMDLS